MDIRNAAAGPAALRPVWHRNRRIRSVGVKILTYIVILLGAAIIIFPFFWEITTSLKSPRDVYTWPPVWIPWPLHFENYSEVANTAPLITYIKNSSTIVTLVILGTEVSCVLAAYGFSRFRFPGRQVLFMILISSLIVPTYATLLPQFVIFQKIGWYNTYKPLIVPAFFGNAFFIFLLRQFFMGISPELEDAARIDGAGYLRTLFSIILPLSKPALATVAIFQFVWTWNDFFSPLVFLSDQQRFTLPLGLVFFTGSPHSTVQIHLLMAMSVIIVAPCVLVYFFAQRMFIQGIVITGVKG